MKNVFNKVLDENHVDSILISDVLFEYNVGKTIMHDTMSESECEIKINIFKRRKMETFIKIYNIQMMKKQQLMLRQSLKQ